MRKSLIILGFIATILSTVLVVTPFFKIAIFPSIVGILCGIGLFKLSQKKNSSKKVVQYIFLLCIISLSIMTYKSVTDTSEVGNTEQLEQLEETSKEEAINELEDLDLDVE